LSRNFRATQQIITNKKISCHIIQSVTGCVDTAMEDTQRKTHGQKKYHLHINASILVVQPFVRLAILMFCALNDEMPPTGSIMTTPLASSAPGTPSSVKPPSINWNLPPAVMGVVSWLDWTA
jgi:hypothetical protein